MERRKSSLFGSILFGILFLIGGIILLWWNEGNNVKNIKNVSEVSEAVIEVSSSIIDEENDGKLISTNGDIVIEDEKVYDDTFNVGVKTTYLRRTVEIYQWEEEEYTDSNNKTRYRYNKIWDSNIKNSKSFYNQEYRNPSSAPYKNAGFEALDVKVGEYYLSSEQLRNLPTDIELDISDVVVNDGFKVVGNYITNAKDYNEPEIGDIRISWKYNGWNQATVLAVQNGNTFSSYVSEVGKKVNRVNEGILTSDEMINNLQESNNMLKWVLRAVGIILIILGYSALISPITRLAAYIPFLGRFVGNAVSFVTFLTGLASSLIVIAVAWIRYRTILGISILAICLLLIILIVILIRKNKNKQ